MNEEFRTGPGKLAQVARREGKVGEGLPAVHAYGPAPVGGAAATEVDHQPVAAGDSREFREPLRQEMAVPGK